MPIKKEITKTDNDGHDNIMKISYKIKFIDSFRFMSTKIDKDANDNIMKISYKIKFIDSFKFMSTSLSSLVDNLSEGLHRDKCTYCKYFLDYMITQDDQLIFRCFECQKELYERL